MPDRDTVVRGLHDIAGFIAGRIGIEQARNFLRTIDDVIALLKEQDETISNLNETVKNLLQQIMEIKEYMTPIGKVKDVKAYDELLKEQETELCDRCGRVRLKSSRIAEGSEVGMTDRAYVISRALENKIAIAENCDQNTMLVTLGAMKEILVALKEQEAVEPIPPTDESDLWKCGNCNHQFFRCTHQRYCEMCGKAVKWYA